MLRSGDPRQDYVESQQIVPFRNQIGTTIPAHGVLKLGLLNQQTGIFEGRAVADNDSNAVFNLHCDVPNGRYGQAILSLPSVAIYGDNTAPAQDAVVGTKFGEFALFSGYTGFECVQAGDPGTHTVLVQKESFSSAVASSFAGAKVGSTALTLLVPNTGQTEIPWNDENLAAYDIGGYHDIFTNNSRLTIPSGKAGKYLIVAFITWHAESTGTHRTVVLKKNGSQILAAMRSPPFGASIGPYQSINSIDSLAVGDYVSLFASQDSSGSVNIGLSSLNSHDSWFSISKID